MLLETNVGCVPVRLYVYLLKVDIDDLENVPEVDSWDMVTYINRPVEIHKVKGKFELNFSFGELHFCK